MHTKVYTGIYTEPIHPDTDAFLLDAQQLSADMRLVPYYIWETVAHVFMLVHTKQIPASHGKKILKALLMLHEISTSGTFTIAEEIGDIHENIEHFLTEKLGPVAGYMHTGRSRNDSITCDQKLLTRDLLFTCMTSLSQLIAYLLATAKQYAAVSMPGYTHARIAMPSSYGFWLQSYALQMQETGEILKAIYPVLDTSPLGAGASYGVNWNINPVETARYLGFARAFDNALSAINNRGLHETYLIGPLASLMTVLSRFMEDIIFFSMPEIGYIHIDESFTTGSSIMPQKMNPDIAEKIRGATGRLPGTLLSLYMSLKGTLAGYNRDSAESKIIIIHSLTDVDYILKTTHTLLQHIAPVPQKMQQAILPSLATKLADAIAQELMIPFRQAHIIVGTALKNSEKDISVLTQEVLQSAVYEVTGKQIVFYESFLSQVLDLRSALQSYSYSGSPAPQHVRTITQKLEKKNKQFSQWIETQKSDTLQKKKELFALVQQFLTEAGTKTTE